MILRALMWCSVAVQLFTGQSFSVDANQCDYQHENHPLFVYMFDLVYFVQFDPYFRMTCMCSESSDQDTNTDMSTSSYMHAHTSQL